MTLRCNVKHLRTLYLEKWGEPCLLTTASIKYLWHKFRPLSNTHDDRSYLVMSTLLRMRYHSDTRRYKAPTRRRHNIFSPKRNLP